MHKQTRTHACEGVHTAHVRVSSRSLHRSSCSRADQGVPATPPCPRADPGLGAPPAPPPATRWSRRAGAARRRGRRPPPTAGGRPPSRARRRTTGGAACCGDGGRGMGASPCSTNEHSCCAFTFFCFYCYSVQACCQRMIAGQLKLPLLFPSSGPITILFKNMMVTFNHVFNLWMHAIFLVGISE